MGSLQCSCLFLIADVAGNHMSTTLMTTCACSFPLHPTVLSTLLQGTDLPLPTLSAAAAAAPPTSPTTETHVHTEQDAQHHHHLRKRAGAGGTSQPPMQDAVCDQEDEEEEALLTWSSGIQPPHDDTNSSPPLVDVISVHLHVDDAPPASVQCMLTVDHGQQHVACVLTVDHCAASPSEQHVEVTLAIHHMYHEGALATHTQPPLPLRLLFARSTSTQGGALVGPSQGGRPFGELGRAASNVAQAAGQGLVGISGRVWGAAVHTATHAAGVGHARQHSAAEGGMGSTGTSPRMLVDEPPATEAQRAQRDAALEQVGGLGLGCQELHAVCTCMHAVCTCMLSTP